MNSTKLAVSLGAVALAVSGLTATAATNVVSDPVGFYKIAINPGANAISAPLQEISTFKGTVASVSGDIITFSGTPGFGVNAFNPVTVNGSPRAQYVAILCNDADKAANDPNNATGDWWTIAANAAGSVTVVNGGDTISSFVAAGDQIEIRKLNSFAKLFGPVGASILAPSPDGSADPAANDVVRFVQGTSFVETWVYIAIEGFEGYYIDGNGPFDPATISVLPNAALVYFRKPDLMATNLCVLGGVQVKRLTHYLVPGPNTIGAVFPASATLVASGMEATAGWVPSPDGSSDPAVNDFLRELTGTSFGPAWTYVNDGMGTTGWFDGVDFPSPEAIEPSKAYTVFVKNGSGARRFRQNVPFNQ